MDKKVMDILNRLMEGQERVETRLKENTQILKALEHRSEANKAEHDRFFHELAEIKGELKSIRKDVTKVELVTSSNWNDIARLKAVSE